MGKPLGKHRVAFLVTMAVIALSISTGLILSISGDRKADLERLSNALSRPATEEEERLTMLRWGPAIEEVNREQARNAELRRQAELDRRSTAPDGSP